MRISLAKAIPFGALAALGAVAASSPALARSAAPAVPDGVPDGLGACLHAVSRIGAQMGHEVTQAAQGHEIYVFTVRSDGGQYRVPCDGKTATLGLVERVADAVGSSAER
ncbi:MAG: hypothetical protein NW205_00125 [Hyphomicrobiaceae bacterium]|nr:hypothetical protein [Hyphomicrobiaceae bacterium]